MIDWRPIRLVAFDVDGTLYAQRPLRLKMLAALGRHSIRSRSLRTFAVLQSYRTIREELGDAETAEFDDVLLAKVGQRHGLPPAEVSRHVAEWMEKRPLESLAGCRYPAVDRLFDRIKRSGRMIGVLSDYPSRAKIEALGLRADHQISASDVGLLKPHPRGLQRLMELAGAAPSETVLIGDRQDRDGEAARRAGCACLLRSDKPIPDAITFKRFDDPLFDGLDEQGTIEAVA